MSLCSFFMFCFFFFNDTATTEIYTLSLHDALPILDRQQRRAAGQAALRGPSRALGPALRHRGDEEDRKSTRLNSNHANISYAVFCLKKKKQNRFQHTNIPRHMTPYQFDREQAARDS